MLHIDKLPDANPRLTSGISFRAEDRGLRGSTRIFLGSAGCQPAGFGNLPKQSSPNQILLSGTFCPENFSSETSMPETIFKFWRQGDSNP
ncbi:MAG: hypothetical protein DMF27_04650 [Verrucomicrobia bacterium]|nr:MAG: hypothetical protein DMF27_04650 [Verrucomicrobiota bacterium]